jgi:hypothetical protein
MKPGSVIGWIVGVALLASACSGGSTLDADTTTTLSTAAAGERVHASAVERLDAIDDAIARWRTTGTIEEADAAAEIAANLVVGPNGPGYGDRDGDGVIGGTTDVGLLPGLDGTPVGLASPLAGNACVDADVLGGSWDEPEERWDEMVTAIDAWRPDNNTMPSLASHPMRIVGWSTFTRESGSLQLAHEYAGHARLHIDISLRALDC